MICWRLVIPGIQARCAAHLPVTTGACTRALPRGARFIGIAIAASALLTAAPAASEDTARERAAAAARVFERPHTQAELGIGMLTLPTSEFCFTAPQTCTRGDASPLGYITMLYHPNGDWAFGAGASLGLPAGSDSPADAPSIDRSHTRSYLMFDGVARYYALRLGWLEGWVGGTLGMVVVNDTYTNDRTDPSAPILGPKGVTLRSEGFSAGLAMGLGWTFARDWSVEGMLRTAWWRLPPEPLRAPTGDNATLTGQVAMFSLGVAIAYRIGL